MDWRTLSDEQWARIEGVLPGKVWSWTSPVFVDGYMLEDSSV